jgi:hypothetical protein
LSRCGATEARPTPLALSAPVSCDDDAALAMDGIVEFFDGATANSDVQRRPTSAQTANDPIESIVNGFVADFQ